MKEDFTNYEVLTDDLAIEATFSKMEEIPSKAGTKEIRLWRKLKRLDLKTYQMFVEKVSPDRPNLMVTGIEYRQFMGDMN